jgi:hypothetical protein
MLLSFALVTLVRPPETREAAPARLLPLREKAAAKRSDEG